MNSPTRTEMPPIEVTWIDTGYSEVMSYDQYISLPDYMVESTHASFLVAEEAAQ